MRAEFKETEIKPYAVWNRSFRVDFIVSLERRLKSDESTKD